MDDIRLHHLLRADPLDAVAITPLLREAASCALSERFVFFGVLDRALAHEDEGLRVACAEVLAGADGYPAFCLLAKLLDDPAEAVRVAAVEALRSSCESHPARWAHAVFHPDASVRRAALGGAPPSGTAHLILAALVDPEARAALLTRIHLVEIVVPEKSLPLLLDLVGRGHLARSEARGLLPRVGSRAAVTAMAAAPRRNAEELAALLAGVRPTGAERGHDTLDEVLDLAIDLPGDGEDAAARTHAELNELIASISASEHDLRERVVGSLLVLLAARGRLPPAALRLLGLFHPPFLAFEWADREARRVAALALYGGPILKTSSAADVRALLSTDLFRRPSGTLDLEPFGAVLRLLDAHPYKHALRWFGTDLVIRSFVEDMHGSVRFLSLEDDSKLGKRYILERVAREGGFGPAVILAFTVLATSGDGLARIIEPLTNGAARDLLVELLGMLESQGQALAPKKLAMLRSLFAAKIAAFPAQFLDAWLSLRDPSQSALGVALLGSMAIAMDADTFADLATALDDDHTRRLVAALPFCTTFPYGKELRLAVALASHPHPEVRAWAHERVPTEVKGAAAPAPPRPDTVPALARAAAWLIATTAEADLDAALAPALREPTTGLTNALARRPNPTAPSIAACAALLACHDEMEPVAEQFARFGSSDPAWLSRLDREVLAKWDRERRLPLLGHAWLHRFEAHAFAFAAELVAAGAVATLRRTTTLASPVLRAQPLEALAGVVGMWRWRDRAALASLVDDPLVDTLVAALGTEGGEGAAQILVTLHKAGSHASAEGSFAETLARVRPAVVEALPDLTEGCRRVLSSWIESRGLVFRSSPRPAAPKVEDARWRIETLSDVLLLGALCRSDNAKLAEDAALRLMELGEAGLVRLAIEIVRAPPCLSTLVETIALWPASPALETLREATRRSGPYEVVFRIALALAQRGERDFGAHAVAAALPPSEPWFTRADWDALVDAGQSQRSLSLALARSPHPHAYTRAVEHLMATGARPASADEDAWLDDENETAGALRAFLDAGTERLAVLRRRAARWLLKRRDFHGFSIALEERVDNASKHLVMGLLDDAPRALVAAAVRSLLVAGPRVAGDSLACEVLESGAVDRAARRSALETILLDAVLDATRRHAADLLEPSKNRGAKLSAVAETFAWGVRLARELTGRVFSIKMIGDEALGYTRLHESQIHVTPLPVLRREPNGRAIVEGLILHELGHHVHHRGEEADAAWKTAQKEGLHGLLNLVADEHLERNLRARSREFGDRLKILDAYGFQHAAREVNVENLVGSLGARAFEVLVATRLGVARRRDAVSLHSGAVLGAMERRGLAFARFMRALRMGLGNRHGDPMVDAGLALFCDGFRQRSMPELLEIARKLRAIFGWQTTLCESVGSHETMPGTPTDGIIHGEGLSDEEVEREVERILDPEKRAPGVDGGKPGRPWINVNPKEHFDPVKDVVRVAYDPALHGRYARAVALDASRMRRFFEELGLALEPQRMRLSGRRFDTTRTQALVLRGDPRILIARQLRVRTDLFVGVLVDCSGSMQSRDNIERAKHFAVLLAEAGRGLRGVDVRLFGFTDKVIYDAGDAARCAASSLVAGGGNNDAAALWHAVNAARASRRRAKLLVMISDGLPTECSVAALRAVVGRASTRLGVCCAQVAVAKLAEQCFPHHVLLDGDDMSAAVRQFGAVIAKLVRRAMAA